LKNLLHLLTFSPREATSVTLTFETETLLRPGEATRSFGLEARSTAKPGAAPLHPGPILSRVEQKPLERKGLRRSSTRFSSLTGESGAS